VTDADEGAEVGLPDAALLHDTVDHLAINRLQAGYADLVTRRDWSALHDLFLPGATVVIDTVTRPAFECVGPGALGDFIGAAVERFDFFEFVVLNSLVTLRADGDPDAARARIFMCEQRRAVADQSWTTAYGLYQDTYRRVDGRWWVASRDYRSLARNGDDGGSFGIPDLPARP
jgi:hypothetical protein